MKTLVLLLSFGALTWTGLWRPEPSSSDPLHACPTVAADRPAWEEVEATFLEGMLLDDAGRQSFVESTVAWPAELTVEWVRAEFGVALRPAELASLDALVCRYNPEIELRAHEYVLDLNGALRTAMAEGNFKRSVAGEARTVEKEEGSASFFAASAVHRGWSVALRLESEAHPELVHLRQQTQRLRRTRDAAVRAFLADNGLDG